MQYPWMDGWMDVNVKSSIVLQSSITREESFRIASKPGSNTNNTKKAKQTSVSQKKV